MEMLRLSRPGRGFPSGPALFLTDYYIALPMAEPLVSAVSRRIRWVAGVPDLNKNSPVVHFC